MIIIPSYKHLQEHSNEKDTTMKTIMMFNLSRACYDSSTVVRALDPLPHSLAHDIIPILY